MSAPDVTGLCFRCGGVVPAEHTWCPCCGMPAIAECSTPAAEAEAGLSGGTAVLPIVPPAALPSVVAPSGSVVPAYLAGPDGPGPLRTAGPLLSTGPVRVRRSSRRPWIAAALIVLVLVATGGAARLLRKADAAGAVEDYFSALADGQGARAMKFVVSGSQLTAAGRFPLLGDAALTQKAHRPSHVQVGQPVALTQPWRGLDASTVPVSYRAGATVVSQPIVVVHSGDHYLLDTPFVEVAIVGAAGRAVSLNGLPLGRTTDTYAFPGEYDATATGNALLSGGQASGTPASGPRGMTTALDLSRATLADGAPAAIQSKARAALDQCAATTTPITEGCPFGLNVPGTAAAVHWSITTYPAISAVVVRDPFGGVGVVLSDDHTGRVHWDVDYTGFDGRKRHETGDLAFTVSGSAQLTGAGIQVSLAG